MASADELYAALEKADKAGATDDARQIAAMIREQEAAAPTPQPPRVVAGTAADGTRRGSKGFFDRGGGLTAFGVNAAEALTFGAAGPVAAYIASTLSHGTDNPMDYKTARARQQAYEAELNEENPWSAGAGSIAGSIVPGIGLAKAGAKVLPGVARALTPTAKDGVIKTGFKLAGAGAVSGAGSNLIEQGVDQIEAGVSDVDTTTKSPITDAVVAGGLGGIAGPVVGGLTGGAAKAYRWGADKATGNVDGAGWRYFSKKLETDPDVLEQAINDHVRLTGGQRPSLAQIMDMRQQGVLSELAATRHRAGAVFREAADEANEALPGQVRDQIRRTVGAPRSTPEMEMATKAPGDRFMSNARQNGDDIFIDTNTRADLNRPDFRDATRDLPSELRQKLAYAMDGNMKLTTSEIDIIRQQVRDWGDAAVGNKGSAQEIQRSLTNLAERSSPGYEANTVRAHESGKLREEGFADGLALAPNTGVMGGTIREGEALAGYGEGVARRAWAKAGAGPNGARQSLDELGGSSNMQDALASVYGHGATDDLVQGARALRSGQKALDTIAPQRVGSDALDAAKSFGDAAGAIVATTHGSNASMASRLIQMLPGGMSEKTAERMAKMLVDPNTARQGIANLRRAGASNEQIAELTALGARVGGDRNDIARERRVPLEVTVRPRRRD